MASEPGDPVGLQAIQYLMHGATQSNLSSFHTAGAASSVLTPTIQQLLDVSKNPICRTSLYFRQPLPAWKIVRRSLWSIVRCINIMHEFEEDDWYALGREMGIIHLVYEPDTLVLRIELDYRAMKDLELSLDIISRFFHGYNVARSPDIVAVIDVHADDIGTIIDVIGILRNVTFGIEDLDHFSGSHVAGSNLMALFSLEEIDTTRTISNHIVDVYNALGLEAARDVLHEELCRYITPKYAHVIADFMTRDGTLDSFSKGQKFDKDKGILLSMALERPSSDIQMLAYRPAVDNLNNSYSRLMVGKSPDVGTGYVQVPSAKPPPS